MPSVKPKIYYGLHMVEGVAEYREEKTPYRILVNEKTCKEMDHSFQGCPVYVRHVPEVDLSKLQEEADGVVVRSFFNQSDGRHWCEFVIFTDQGMEAIDSKKWKLSNAYVVKNSAGGGEWHGVPYQKQVTRAEYEHLAIVPNPRYAESVILTPEEFKTYNAEKEAELLRLANSDDKGDTMFHFLKKSKVENEQLKDLESLIVTLPKSKKDVLLTTILKNADEEYAKGDAPQMANDDHHVDVGGHKMSVGELKKKHLDCMNEIERMKEEKNSLEQLDPGEDKEKADLKEAKYNEEKEKLDKAHNDALSKLAKDHGKETTKVVNEKTDEEKRKEQENFEKIKNAHNKSRSSGDRVIETSADLLARGQQRYGTAQ